MIDLYKQEQNTANVEEKASLMALPDVQGLFAALQERSLIEIIPRLNAKGDIIYPDANRFLRVDNSESAEILEKLVQAQLLVKEPANPLPLCPLCNSSDTSQSIVCPNCGSSELISGPALQHLSCLHFDFEFNFKRKGAAVFCPKCNRQLASPEVDYLRRGTFLKCVSCNEFTALAKRLVVCHKCQQVSETPKALTIHSYKYKLNRNNQGAIYLPHFDVVPLHETLTRKGYNVQANAKVRGKSGVDHTFSLMVTRSHHDTELRVAVDIEVAPVEVDQTYVLSMFARAVDCGLQSKVLIAIPRLNEQAKMLALSYNMIWIEAKDSSDAGEQLQAVLGSVSERKTITSRSRSGTEASRKRSTIDIMADILVVVTRPSSKYEMMACANLSYDQCQKYIPMLEKLGLLRKYLEDGMRTRFAITEKGREYLASIAGEFGRIAQGDKSIWSTKRQSSDCATSTQAVASL